MTTFVLERCRVRDDMDLPIEGTILSKRQSVETTLHFDEDEKLKRGERKC